MDVAASILSQLTTPLVEELGIIWNFKDDLENLKNTVSAIKAVLGDAEGKTNNLQVSDWLKKVKDLFFDADDLLDDFSCEVMRRQVMTKNKRLKKHYTYRGRKHTFSEPEDEIFGREDEKKRIVRYLLDSENEEISVVSIVGIGGLGKTALAQLVYNDENVHNYFDMKMWRCVADEFALDVQQIAQKILGGKEIEMEQLKVELRKKIEGKRFLLVLDDVWSEDRDIWLKVKKLLMGGRRGSMILVTTRSKNVGRVMNAKLSVALQGLDDTKSWELFSRMAFEKDENPKAELIEIGKDIVKKCAGVPLAIRTVGSLLYSRNLGERDWIYFRDTELSNIDEERNGIFDILKLSYDHLPSCLKNCFAYCSLFPKDYEMEKETLIQLWVAQRFIQTSSDQSRSEEDIGHEYFMLLLSRCFFQDVRTNKIGEIKRCKMHDLIHDLARSVSKDEYIVFCGGKEQKFGDSTRHLSSERKSSWKVPTVKAQTNRLRTILLPVGFCGLFPSHLPNLPKHLRVLDLQKSGLSHIPNCIGELKNLKYLDLSENFFWDLPQEITKLHKLQTLKLNGCHKLRGFIITNLVSLKHLELRKYGLGYTPCGLGELTNLQTLSHFWSLRGGASIMELEGLNSLRGKLTIKNLDHEQSNLMKIKSTKLLVGKPNLRELKLSWSDACMNIEEVGDENIIEALQPCNTIKRLCIRGASCKRLPEWIGNLTSLIRLEIQECYVLDSLPESIGNLTSLRELSIHRCIRLNFLPEGFRNMNSLQTLVISSSDRLAERCQREKGEDWPKIAHIPQVIIAQNERESIDDTSEYSSE